MPERPGGAPFINGLPASVIERYEREHPEEQRTAAKEVPEYHDALPWGGREQWQPGERAHFEYHCYEGHDSNDAKAWYHSHQPVTVLEENEDDGQRHMFADHADRADAGMPVSYHVRWGDGYEHTVFEDELLTHPKHFSRPDPPADPEMKKSLS
jgi:hypothetical protein